MLGYLRTFLKLALQVGFSHVDLEPSQILVRHLPALLRSWGLVGLFGEKQFLPCVFLLNVLLGLEWFGSRYHTGESVESFLGILLYKSLDDDWLSSFRVVVVGFRFLLAVLRNLAFRRYVGF